MKRHSEEEFSTEPEVGVVIAKTTMRHIRLNRHKYQFRKTEKKKALTVICTIRLHALFKLKKNYNIFQQSGTQWSPNQQHNANKNT